MALTKGLAVKHPASHSTHACARHSQHAPHPKSLPSHILHKLLHLRTLSWQSFACKSKPSCRMHSLGRRFFSLLVEHRPSLQTFIHPKQMMQHHMLATIVGAGISQGAG